VTRTSDFKHSSTKQYPIVVGSIVLLFTIFALSHTLAPANSRLANAISLSSFSLLFFGTAAAQLFSGFIWRNLSPGNRGIHYRTDPIRFWFSTALNFAVGLSIITCSFFAYFKTE
jgi:hypothetical protein